MSESTIVTEANQNRDTQDISDSAVHNTHTNDILSLPATTAGTTAADVTATTAVQDRGTAVLPDSSNSNKWADGKDGPQEPSNEFPLPKVQVDPWLHIGSWLKSTLTSGVVHEDPPDTTSANKSYEMTETPPQCDTPPANGSRDIESAVNPESDGAPYISSVTAEADTYLDAVTAATATTAAFGDWLSAGISAGSERLKQAVEMVKPDLELFAEQLSIDTRSFLDGYQLPGLLVSDVDDGGLQSSRVATDDCSSRGPHTTTARGAVRSEEDTAAPPSAAIPSVEPPSAAANGSTGVNTRTDANGGAAAHNNRPVPPKLTGLSSNFIIKYKNLCKDPDTYLTSPPSAGPAGGSSTSDGNTTNGADETALGHERKQRQSTELTYEEFLYAKSDMDDFLMDTEVAKRLKLYVPAQVDADQFWKRFLWRFALLEAEDRYLQSMLAKAQHAVAKDDDGIGWD
eukprot:Lankesteria_metandrocarpae@DN4362_c1_g1_i1.p1